MTTLRTVLAITIGVNYVCDIVKTDPSKAVVKDHHHWPYTSMSSGNLIVHIQVNVFYKG